MAGGLIALGKRREKERIQAMAKEPAYNRGLVALGQKSNTEKNRGGIPGAIGYLGGNVVTGAGQMVEGIVDVGMAGADLLRGDTDMAQYRFLKNVTKEWDEELERSYNPGTVMQIGGDVASGIGTSLVFMIPKAGIFLGAAGTFGSNVSQAAEMTGEVGLKELGYAAAATVPEILLEKTIGAATRGGKALLSAGSKALTKGTAKAGVKAVGKTATKVSKSLLGHVALETAKSMAGEGAEEAITEAIDPFLLRLFQIDENAQLDMGNVVYAGLIGSLSGGLMTSGPAAINYKSSQAAGRMIREAGLTDAFLDETRELLGGADRAKTKAEAAKGEKVNAEEGSGVIGKVTAMGKNTVNTVRQSKIASSAKRIAETTRKNLQSFEQFNAKENKTAQEQAIADAMLGELRGNVYLLETSYLSETYEQAILDATPEQKQDIVDFINKSMAAKNAAKSDYTVADLDADTDGILTSMAAKYVEGDLERYMGIHRVDRMEGRGRKATETAEEAATSPWDGMADNEDMSGYKATGEAENALLKASVNQSVPRGSVQAMLDEYRKGTDLTPEEFAAGWSDGAHIYGRYGLNVDEASPLSRMSPEAREAALKFGRETEEAERKAAEEKAKAKKKPAEMAGKKGTVVRGDGLNVQKLSDEQYVAYKGAELLAEVLGTEIVIENGITDKAGRTVNGYYDTKTNRIHININAMRDGKNISLYTLGHEATHYIKEWSPTKFEALADFVLDQMGVDAETAVADKLASLKRLGIVTDTMTIAEANAMAREELVAEGMELVLTDGKVLEELSKTDKSLWQKIRDWFFDIIGQIRRSWQDLNQASKTAQVLKETVESLEEIERLFTEGVREAGERTRTAEAGVIVDDASGTAMLSVDDIPKTEQEIDDAVNRLVKKLGVDESRARQWVQNELSLATLILRDDMVDYAHRKADRRLTAIVKNSDYKQGTLDFSNICRKRREYTRMMQRIQQAFPNRRFTAEEFATIRKIMVDEGLEVACGLCYVEDRRQNEGYIAETFQRAVEAWRKGNRDTYYDTKNNVESTYNKGQAKAMAMLEGGDYVPTIADLTTVEGMEKLQREHPDILRAWRGFNNARGMASARLLTGEAEYQRQILKYSKARVKQINDLGGLRVFSLSDFEEFHLIDIIQAVQDCAAMGIKIQFYTKVPSFALLMKDTKAKGNLSLIPKGDLGYEMKNGKRVLVYDPVEGIDFNDPAFKKVARGNPNIGTILVGINDDHIRTAMEDDFIDYIIPFHTGQTEVVRRIKKIGKWQNYKNEQVDKPWESGSKAKPVNVYTDVIAAAEREGNPIRNERQFVERFLKVCEERGLRPRFSRFLNTNAEGKYVYTKGYYKLLLDFKMFDKDGTYLPQEAVIPEFDADLLHELTEKYVAGEKAKTEAESPAFQRALERVEAEVVGDDEGRMYSIDETPETPDVSENATDTNVGGTEEELTDRDMLLAMAERLVGNEKENEILTRYKEQQEAQLRREDKLDSIYDEVDEQRGILYTDPDAAKRSAAAKRLKELFKDVDKISSEIAEVDRELTKIAGMKIMRNLIVRERKTSKKIYQEWYHQMYTRNKETRETTDMRRQVRRIYGRVSRLMFAPTRTKSVPYELKPVIAEALKMADMDGEAIARLGELEQQLARLEREAVRDEDKIAKKKREIENQEKKVGKMKEQTELMIKIFEKSKEIKDGVGAAVYDEGAMNLLKGLQAKMGNASIRNANKEQLQALKDFYDVMYHRINTANNTFASQRAENIDDIGSQSTEQVKTTKALKFLSPRAMELAGLAGVRGFFWKNMKPLTVFDAIGSETFAKLFKNVMDGEIVWATDVEEASKVINEARAKYGHAKWKQDERVAVQTKDGEVKLSLAERMSLYAYFQRLQAMNHLEFGGFKLDPTATDMGKGRVIKFVDMKRSLNDAQAYRLDKELAGKISATLTAEQKAYVEEVQKYLTEMGKKGNEVSRKLYGMDIFTEEFYFPIKVVSDVLQSQTGKTGDPKIKNQGMTKELVQDAKEPMLLQGFDDVMVEHINNMATYHAFVLPVEDLTRVLNYKPANFKRDKDGNVILNDNGLPVSDPDAQKDFTSLKAVIQAKYGVDAVNYIEQLLRDLNGGARRDAAATILDKGLTAFKRAATTMSASTIIQQPTSVIRAMAYVDAKHFSGASITPWETVKKYAKVAFIKEMGGFDTGTGARTQEFLNQREYDNIGQKVKAAVTPEVYGGDPQARAEFFGWLTSKADEKTWCFLFGAVVNEQAERLGKPKDSEEVLKAAGERFTEVVRRTQVYDSTLTRSQYMRSKDGLMKMATSFMAEPTTVVSMAADAIIRLERGDKMFIRKTAAGIAGSIILNAMAVSLIYAMRDDDEEKNYLEKYISSLTGEIVEGLNPLEYFPILRDIMSLFKGYEIERSDMTLINNLLEQVEMITSSKRSFMDKMIGVTGAVAAFFGIPVTNLYRDVKGLTTTTISLFNGEPVTAKGTASAALEGVTDQFGLFKKLLGGDRGTSYELYRAKVSGDKSHYDRVAARYDSPEAEEQALRRELRENDKRIGEAAEARRSGDIEVYKSLVEQITDEGIFDRGMVIRAIQTEMNALSRETEKGTVVPKDTEVADEETVEVVSLYSSSDLNAALERGDTEDFKEILDSMISDRVQAGKTEAQAKSAVKSSITAYWKPRYIEARNANDTETMKKILQILLSSGLYGSRNDVAVMLEGWIKAYAKSK